MTKRQPEGRRFAAWLVATGCGLVAVPTILLIALGASTSTPADDFGLAGFGGLAFLAGAAAFSGAGALLVSQVPQNAIGPVFCTLGLLLASGDFAYQYADYGLFVEPGALPAADGAAVSQNLLITPCFGLLGLSLLLFPAGSLFSPRWRPAAAAAMTGSVLVALGYLLRPGVLDEPFELVSNPFGVGSYDLMNTLSGLGWLLMSLSVAVGAVGMVIRLRRASGIEHQQLKLIALAAALVGVAIVLNGLSFALEVDVSAQARLVVVGLAFTAIPVAAGIAILRYRLYDIDVVINRTLVYGALTATLAATYLATVLLFQLVLGGLTAGSNLAIAASTLAVAALFRPARSRIQDAVNRRFYRRRYDARRTLESFSARLRDEVDLAALEVELGGVVAETMQPAHVSLWLRGPAGAA